MICYNLYIANIPLKRFHVMFYCLVLWFLYKLHNNITHFLWFLCAYKLYTRKCIGILCFLLFYS